MSSSDILHQLSSSPSSAAAAAAALLVAGLGAVTFAFTQLGGPAEEGSSKEEGEGGSRTKAGVVESEFKHDDAKGKTRRRKKGKKDTAAEVGSGTGTVGGQGKQKTSTGGGNIQAGTATAAAVVVQYPNVVPGDFEVTPAAGTNTDAAASSVAAPSLEASPMKEGNATKRKKQKKQNKGKNKGTTPDDIRGGPPRSGDTTDTSVSGMTPALSPVGLGSTGNVPTSVSRPAPPAQLTSSRARQPSQSLDTDSSWTHVQHHHGKTTKSADPTGVPRLVVSTDVTSSDVASTASDSPVTDTHHTRGQGDQRTLAEKLVPKPRKTGVDDMLEEPDFPTLARVMRVQPRAGETPVPGFSWEDYGDVIEDNGQFNDADEEDEGGWGVVMGKNRQRTSRTTSTSTSTPAAAAAAPSSGTMTKKQRQNAKKRELVKAAKVETEAARLEGLTKHKRELERLRIIEQSHQSGGKRPSGGMQATVDSQGKLVWE